MILFHVPVNYLLPVAMVLVPPLVLTRDPAATLGAVTAVGGLGAASGALAMVLSGGTKRLTVWSLAGLAYRPLRLPEDDLPDAVADAEIAEDLDEVQRRLDQRLLVGRA